MSSVILMVETDGGVDMFGQTQGSGNLVQMLAARGVRRTLSVGLNQDGTLVATVMYDPSDPDVNDRATALTGLLCGSYVQVLGLAAIMVYDQDVALAALEASAP